MTCIILIISVLLLAALVWAVYASAAIGSGVYLKALCHAGTAEKVVAITFDDAPDATMTPRVLAVLKRYDAPATFFCIGSKIQGNEAVMRQITNDGHLLGNHSFSHSPGFPLFTRARMTDDLARCDEALAPFIPPERRYALFRPPFGVTNPTVAAAAKARHYTVIGWNIRSYDTCRRRKQAFARIRKRLSPGSIILLHDRLPDSDKLLDDILQFLRHNGYRVVSLDHLLKLKPATRP